MICFYKNNVNVVIYDLIIKTFDEKYSCYSEYNEGLTFVIRVNHKIIVILFEGVFFVNVHKA